MITLFAFGPVFGLPDMSPFVTKAHLLLKLAGLPYQVDRKGFTRAPKGKLPYINDAGEIVADSTFIRLHIERKYRVDFNRNLAPERSAAIWALEKMCENHLYWAAVRERWMREENFEKIAALVFRRVPPLVRPVVKTLVRRKIRKDLYSQGLGRHSEQELAELVKRDVVAIAALLGDAPWLGGGQPCGGDATLGAFVITCHTPEFTTDVGRLIGEHANLLAYRERVLAAYFADLTAN
ncbi:glutathione S-transferase family protein [Labrys okinawensis]|uniref:glutathione S-transferase family protein n=1 Tax=Labrys okinawensis TaxID=346911 RepID=UPI0039BC3E52